MKIESWQLLLVSSVLTLVVMAFVARSFEANRAQEISGVTSDIVETYPKPSQN